eukprot:SAG31_NODE_875_length_11316_cov_8.924044_4_plen_98_part_00
MLALTRGTHRIDEMNGNHHIHGPSKLKQKSIQTNVPSTADPPNVFISSSNTPCNHTELSCSKVIVINRAGLSNLVNEVNEQCNRAVNDYDNVLPICY